MNSLFNFQECVCMIVAPLGSGKSNLIKYLMYDRCEQIAGVVLFANTGLIARSSYDWLNPMYIYDYFDKELLTKIIKLGAKIKNHDPKKFLIIIFDDCIGMFTGMFKGNEAKKVITTLRHENVVLMFSLQQFQNESTTLMRTNSTDVFLFAQTEAHGLELLYKNYGIGSYLKDDFKAAVSNLPKYHFLYWSKNDKRFQQLVTPYPLPKFRLYLHPQDLKKKEEGYIVVAGNNHNYDLRSIERDDMNDAKLTTELPEFRKDDDDEDEDLSTELYKNIDDDVVDEDDNSGQMVQVDDELYEGIPEEKPKEKQSPINTKETSKRKRKSDQMEEADQLSKPLTQKDQIVRFRCIQQLQFAERNELLYQRVSNVYGKDFFPTPEQYLMIPLEELIEKRRMLYNAFQIDNMTQNIQAQYDMLSTGCKLFANCVLDFDGPELALFDQMFQDDVALNTLDGICKLNPMKRYKPSAIDRVMRLMAPAGKLMWRIKDFQDVKKKTEELGNRMIDTKQYKEMLQ
jgi:hypothetical protein